MGKLDIEFLELPLAESRTYLKTKTWMQQIDVPYFVVGCKSRPDFEADELSIWHNYLFVEFILRLKGYWVFKGRESPLLPQQVLNANFGSIPESFLRFRADPLFLVTIVRASPVEEKEHNRVKFEFRSDRISMELPAPLKMWLDGDMRV